MFSCKVLFVGCLICNYTVYDIVAMKYVAPKLKPNKPCLQKMNKDTDKD